MNANQWGKCFCLTTFGESHGPAMGVVVDGCPAGVPFDEELLQQMLDRRRPGKQAWTSPRNETDTARVLSGVYLGKTLGTPIAIVTDNQDAQPQDYEKLKLESRPGHATDLWQKKFQHSDPRGSGRASGRETVCRVMAGAVARMLNAHLAPDLKLTAFASAIGPMVLTEQERSTVVAGDDSQIDGFTARFPSTARADDLAALLADAVEQGESYGGEVEMWIDGLPSGLGQPVFHKLKADLAAALLSVGATSAVGVGAGFSAAAAQGKSFHQQTDGSSYGGIRGGLSTGERVLLSVSFKPTSSLGSIAKKGRHDPCIVPRAIPVLQAMVQLVVADHLLWMRQDRL